MMPLAGMMPRRGYALFTAFYTQSFDFFLAVMMPLVGTMPSFEYFLLFYYRLSTVSGPSAIDLFYISTLVIVVFSPRDLAVSVCANMAVANTIDRIRAELGSEGANLIWLSERAETDLKAIQTVATPVVSFVGPTAPIGMDMDPAAYMVYRPSDLPIQPLDAVDGRPLFVA